MDQEQQIIAARAFAAMHHQMVEKTDPAELKNYLIGLANADTKKDGIITGEEMAAGLAGPKGMLGKHRPTPELCMNDELLGLMVAAYNYTGKRTIDILQNPDKPVTDGVIIPVKVNMAAFARATGIAIRDIMPEVIEILTKSTIDYVGTRDKKVIATHKAMVEGHEIGVLPRQVLPMKPKDLCSALNARSA